MDVEEITLGNCQVDFYRDYYSPQQSAEIVEQLAKLPYGYTYFYMPFARKGSRWSKSHRKMIWLTEDPDWVYFFSNNHVGGLKPHDLNQYPFLLDIKKRIERTTGQKFNALLVNEYVGGSEKLNWHDDDDKWLGPQDRVIVPSLSFGTERDFQLRLKKDRKKKITIKTVDGSLMVMKGLTQVDCHHQVPARSKVTGVRYNLTFRYIHPDLVDKMPRGSKRTLEEAWEMFPETKPVVEDFDTECGFWLYNRPYVWVQGLTKETSGRLYLVYNKDHVYIHTRKGCRESTTNPYDRAFDMADRRIPFSSYRYYPQTEEDTFRDITMLDLFANRSVIDSCSWAARYFGVYQTRRDGDLENLDVRRNGVPFHPPPGTRPGIVGYLKAAGLHKPGSVSFIKLPGWLDWEVVGDIGDEKLQRIKEAEEHRERLYQEELLREQELIEEEWGFWNPSGSPPKED